ncbi:MAG: ABC transporter permease subunit, partial [Planctomycetes bacterium]|nr:ABC transporter permease subunit [Planctomycetota bacterium]
MTLGSVLSLNWLTGPILAKELRQASRRPWLMIVKTAYVLLLVILIFIACDETRHSDDAWQQMSYYGQALTRVIVWFQFVALQLIAVAAMSTSISDEVRRRTLVTLLSTPITPLQIVMGKLLSRLMTIAMLIGISLPVLAIMRVFGGVPWDFLVRGLCITATAVLFAAAVSLFFSILCKHAYAVILLAMGSFLMLYFVLPFVAAWLIHDSRWVKDASDEFFFAWLMCIINPYYSMTVVTMESFAGRAIMGSLSGPWGEHCLTMLGLSALVLWRCVAMVRKKSMREGEGFVRSRKAAASPPPYQPPTRPVQQAISVHSPDSFNPGLAHDWAQKAAEAAQEMHRAENMLASAPRPVRGNPITWKETASPLFASRAARWIVLGLAGLVILTIYYIAGSAEEMHGRGFNIVMISVFLFLGLLTAGSVAAGSVSGEKEGSTLELLLTTQIRPWTIAWGKFAGSFRRSLIVWLPPAVHIPI